ncbi:MAG: ClbS/DfsB family four-helix bundle protein [Chloroflexaceae bacterium]|nr:ClbS/DfsB family four-helix bundle protein [Chloroflexaceae bacterium]
MIHTLKTERAHLEMLLSQINEENMLIAGVAGEMSVKDIIAHITWYERETVGLLQQRALVGSDLWYRSLEERNGAILAANRHRQLNDVQVEAEKVFIDLINEIESLLPEELVDPTRFQGMPTEWVPWQAIASNTYDHYYQHIPDIKRWIEHCGR